MPRRGRSIARLVAGAVVLILAVAPGRAQTCVADGLETDDACVPTVTVIGGGESQTHNFCDDAADWIRFNACAGRSYTVQTTSLGTSADTLLELYEPDCGTLIAADDNGGGGLASRIDWSSPIDGVYHVRVRQANGTVGADRDYVLQLVGDTSACSSWVRNYQTPDYSHVTGIQQLADGGYIMAGGLRVLPNSSAGYHLWVLNVDPSGAIRWQRSFNVADGNPSPSIAQTVDGGYLLAERTEAYSTSADDSKTLLLRLDASGAILWHKVFGGVGADVARKIIAMPDGGFALAGFTSSYFPFLDGDLWVMRGDSSGNVIWSYRYHRAGSDDGHSIAATSDGGFIVLGSSAIEGVVVIKLDASGTIQWQKSYQGDASAPDTIAPLADGGFLVTGLTVSFSPVSGSPALWLIRLDGVGHVVWQKSYYAGAGFSGSTAQVATMPDSGFVVAGTYTGSVQFVPWIFRIDASGTVVWSKRDASAGSSAEAIAVTRTTDGGLAVVESRLFASLMKVRPEGTIPTCSGLLVDIATTVTPTTATETVSSLTRQTRAPTVTIPSLVGAETTASASMECPCAAPAFVGPLLGTRLGGSENWSWGDAGPAVYDVVRGDLLALKASGGNYELALEALAGTTFAACFADNTPLTSKADSGNPSPGEGLFYLVRTVSTACSAVGSYGSQDSAQVGDRDSGINAASNTCP